MRKAIILLFLFSIIATPLYALNIFDKAVYKEVRIGTGKFLVNRATGKVSKKMLHDKYEPLSTEKGFEGAPSQQEMYQTYYDRMKSR
jgi:hypothetical protein